MRRYTDTRYIPYLRTRYKAHVRWNAPVGTCIRDLILLLRFIIFITCVIFALNSFGKNFFSAVQNVSEYKTAQLVNEYIDNGVLEATNLYQEHCFAFVEYNTDGGVSSLETNAISINQFAAHLSDSILKQIKRNENVKIKAPLGALSGNGLLSSLGFSVPYRIVPSGKITVAPKSSFESAGINQTVHRLNMEVSVKVKILFPILGKEEEIKRNILISETVIIGDVPGILFSNNGNE